MIDTGADIDGSLLWLLVDDFEELKELVPKVATRLCLKQFVRKYHAEPLTEDVGNLKV